MKTIVYIVSLIAWFWLFAYDWRVGLAIFFIQWAEGLQNSEKYLKLGKIKVWKGTRKATQLVGGSMEDFLNRGSK